MPKVPRLLLDNVCYHLTTRGNYQQRVFNESEDFEVFLSLLKKYKSKYTFSLYGHCPMPNHVHLLGEIEKSKELPKFMQCLNRAYTAFFNEKYAKVGHLWQARFDSRVITKDEYLIKCINYIEFNPVKAGLVKSPDEYPYSSYRERVLGDKKYSLLDPLAL